MRTMWDFAHALRVLALAAGTLVGGTAASAAILESSTITNSYAYIFETGSDTTMIATGESTKLRVGHVNPVTGSLSEVGIDLTGALDNGNFAFLHNAYCVGHCLVNLRTEIIFTLQNTGPDPANLRFDSLITPGHLAEVQANGVGNGWFQFLVQQTPGGSFARTLYSADGNSYSGSPFVTTMDGKPFNGFTVVDEGQDLQVIDWSATNLNVELLTIGAFETHTLRYYSEVLIGSIASATICTDLADCPGIQIAFGDPRNSGGGTTARSLTGSPTQSAIGREFDAYEPGIAFVPVTEPLPPGQPAVLPAVTYGAAFRSQVAVPEPASWLTMIAGFAMLGAWARRRPVRVRAPG